MEPVAVVVLDGEQLPISIHLTQHRRTHQLWSSLLLQEGPVPDLLMPVTEHVILCYSQVKVYHTHRSVEDLWVTGLDNQKQLWLAI